MQIAVVKAAFDDDAGVRHVEHSDIEGLHVEGETFETFRQTATATADLLFGRPKTFTSRLLRTRLDARFRGHDIAAKRGGRVPSFKARILIGPLVPFVQAPEPSRDARSRTRNEPSTE